MLSYYRHEHDDNKLDELDGNDGGKSCTANPERQSWLAAEVRFEGAQGRVALALVALLNRIRLLTAETRALVFG